MADLADHLVVLAVAFGVCAIAAPLVRLLAPRIGAVAVPGERHIHRVPTPTLGGLAILAGVLAAVFAATRLPAFEEVFGRTSEPEAIVLAALVAVAVGVLDDTRGLSAPAKLAGQILAASMVVLFGPTLRFVYVPGNPGSILALGPDLAAIVTVVAIVAMMNAVNLVDGLDGLAAGIVAIAGLALFAYVWWGDPGTVPVGFQISSASLVLAALVGACLGFLVHNFHPASVFMGDTGALLLGLLLGASGVSAIGSTIQPTRADFAVASVPVLVPALVLAVPFVDTILAILRRLRTGRSVASPDKKHLHHRLIAIGHSHRRAVLIMYFWSALLAFGVVGSTLLPARVVGSVVGIGVGAASGAGLAGAVRRRLQRRRNARLDGEGAIVYPFTSSRGFRDQSRSDKERQGKTRV